VEVTPTYDPSTKTYKLRMTQKTGPTVGQPTKLPFHIPIRVGLLGRDGKEILPSTVLELKEDVQVFEFKDIAEEPVPSVLRGFSAPVKLRLPQSDEDLAFLMAYDTDSFNRWEASQKLAAKAVMSATQALSDKQTPPPLPATMVEAYRKVLRTAIEDPSIDKSLLAYALSLPEELTLLGDMDVMRPLALHEGREWVKRSLASALHKEIREVYDALNVVVPYEVNPREIGRRRLKNVCLGYLATDKGEGLDRCYMLSIIYALCIYI
jgi:aminopeptidase N